MKILFYQNLFLQNILLLSALAFLSCKAGAEFSFEDFLKQLESETPAKQVEQAEEQVLGQKATTPQGLPFLGPTKSRQSDKGKNLEKEIEDILKNKITPLANDLMKIVESSDTKKLLEDKKKQRELQQKEADKRLDQMKKTKQHGYSPSYYPSSGRGGSGWPSSSRGRSGGYGGGYGGGYDGYSPSSSWNKYNSPSSWDDKDKDKGLSSGDKTTSDKDKKKSGGGKSAKTNKDVAKVTNTINNLTDKIQTILSQQNQKLSVPNNQNAINELASDNTLDLLKDLFEQREKQLLNIPHDKHKQSSINKNKQNTTSKTDTKIKDEAKEKAMWERFAPYIVRVVNSESEGIQKAKEAGKELIGMLRAKKYISDRSIAGLSDAFKGQIKKQAEEKDKDKEIDTKHTDPTINKINTYTKKIRSTISNLTGQIKHNPSNNTTINDANKTIYKNLANTLEEIYELFAKREKKLAGLTQKQQNELITKEEKMFWVKEFPALLQATTHTELNEDPLTQPATKEMLDQQALGRKLLKALSTGRYFSKPNFLEEEQIKFEKELAPKIRPKATVDPTGKFTRLRNIAEKLPLGQKEQTLKDALAK